MLFENVNAPAEGSYTLRIYYVSGEPRTLKIDVNGAFAGQLDNCYANRNDWSGIRAASITVQLRAGQNTVKLYNDRAYGPSVDRIALVIPQESGLIGDLDENGRIDARDLTLLKRGLLTQFPSAHIEWLADLDRNGVLDRNDVVTMVQFLTAQA